MSARLNPMAAFKYAEESDSGFVTALCFTLRFCAFHISLPGSRNCVGLQLRSSRRELSSFSAAWLREQVK
ncbi:unnamed protein product [Linum tenue]|uniref:Uncharacterized protein n=1 Tax=Linum tenue TaxID=586396 RepID=A0AAV0QZH9_9ROSI|nr:unnamed protein product [Linum tenue]